jgi:hypothetical protein
MNPQGTALGDAGGAAGSAIPGSGYLTELGITNTGAPLCIDDALTNAVGGYHQLCLGANALGGGAITYNALGGAAPLPILFNLNGTTYQFPYTVGGIVGPTTTGVGETACWNNGVGSLLKDCLSQPVDVSVQSYGAVCDGSTNDAVAINSALASGASIATVPPRKTCAFGSTINIPAGVKLKGAGHNSSTLKALTNNLSAVSINGSFAGLEGLNIQCSPTGTPSTSGNCVTIGSPGIREILINDFVLNAPFIGISTTTSVLDTIQNGYIYSPTTTTGECIFVGGGNNQVLNNVFCEGSSISSQPRAGIEIQQTGGIWLQNFQTLWGGTGVLVDPGNGQGVTWVFDNQGTYDTSSQNGIAIIPSSTGVVRGYYCTECWTSTNALSGVSIGAPPTTIVDDVHFIGHRSYNNTASGIVIGAGTTNTFIQDSSICGNSAAGAGLADGIQIISPATHVTITGNRIGNCAQFTGTTQRFGFNFLGGPNSNEIIVSGNNLTGNITPGFVGFNNGTLATISGNLGIDDQVAVMGSGTTIALPLNPIIAITGTTPIQNITGGWQSRQVTFISGSATPYATGGTSSTDIANAITATPNVPNTAILAGPHWYMK